MSDPFDTLRQPDGPLAPDPAFARRLRERLQAALGAVRPTDRAGAAGRGPSNEDTMTSATPTATPSAGSPDAPATPTPAQVTPYLCVHDGPAALAFYAAAFDARETLRYAGSDGRIGHAEFTIAGAGFALADEHPEIGVLSPRTLGGSAVTLMLSVTDVDALYSRAMAAGATGERPPADQSHGNRTAALTDPFGHRWMLTQPLAPISLEELNARHTGSYTITAGEADGPAATDSGA
jgi:uncharacterized glyoxalase superfamily protein PhnB